MPSAASPVFNCCPNHRNYYNPQSLLRCVPCRHHPALRGRRSKRLSVSVKSKTYTSLNVDTNIHVKTFRLYLQEAIDKTTFIVCILSRSRFSEFRTLKCALGQKWPRLAAKTEKFFPSRKSKFLVRNFQYVMAIEQSQYRQTYAFT